MKRRIIPWLRRDIPYFVEAFRDTKIWLPMELWFLVEDEIQRREKVFNAKCEYLEDNLNFDFDTNYYEDCTERLFYDDAILQSVCFFPATDTARGAIFMHGLSHIFSADRLFRLIDEYFEREDILGG